MTDCSRCAGTTTSGPNHWSERIRDIADFPKPGIVFKDITPLLSDGPD
ncbi:adenine phosphoribosyltransferase, partial [Xanthomonas perforans]